jgi:Zn-finger nucleic acid-binding protein
VIILCPYCGYKLQSKLQSGITSCDSCNRVFDASSYHKILSAFWTFHRWHLYDIGTLQKHCQLNEDEENVVAQAIDAGLSFDDFYKKIHPRKLELSA